jgi:hypothetical protein
MDDAVMMRWSAFLDAAGEDANIVGVFLGGSRGKGFETPHSDFDVYVIVYDAALCKLPRHDPPFEWLVMTLEEFRSHATWNSDTAWNRPTFSHVKALIDKTGEVQALLEVKSCIPSSERRTFLEEALDSYINSVYHSLKCHRRAETLGALLEANASLPFALDVIFGLEGRVRPFLSYLQLELERYPLNSSSETILENVHRIASQSDLPAQGTLLELIEARTQPEFQAVFDGWSEAYPWMKSYLLEFNDSQNLRAKSVH